MTDEPKAADEPQVKRGLLTRWLMQKDTKLGKDTETKTADERVERKDNVTETSEETTQPQKLKKGAKQTNL